MKRFLDENNKFIKENDSYIYKPNILSIGYLFVLILMFFCCVYICIKAYEEEGLKTTIILILGYALIIFYLAGSNINDFITIQINKNGCVFSLFNIKKYISWDEFKVVRFENYSKYKHRHGAKLKSAFPYKECVIFSCKSLKKPRTRAPEWCAKLPFSWFYINFYDEKDLDFTRYRYMPYKFVFDQEEFKNLVKEANIQIEDWPYN